MSKITFKVGDIIIFNNNGLDNTREKYSLASDMIWWAGQKATIQSFGNHRHYRGIKQIEVDHENGLVYDEEYPDGDGSCLFRIIEDRAGYSWSIFDAIPECMVVKTKQTAETRIRNFMSSFNSYENYCCYNNFQLRTDKGGTLTDDGGSCFESYSDLAYDLDEYERGTPESITWWFPRNNGSDSSKFQLSNAEIKRWVYNWSRLGMFRPKINEFVKTLSWTLPMSTNLEELYHHTCIGRYISEQPDTIKCTFGLMDKYGYRFIVAQAIAQLLFGNRSHQMVDHCIWTHAHRDDRTYNKAKRAAGIASAYMSWAKTLPRDMGRTQLDLWDYWSCLSNYVPELSKLKDVTWANLHLWNPETSTLREERKKAA